MLNARINNLVPAIIFAAVSALAGLAHAAEPATQPAKEEPAICLTGMIIVEEVKAGKSPRIEFEGCPAKFVNYHLGPGKDDPPDHKEMIGRTTVINPYGKQANIVFTADKEGRYFLTGPAFKTSGGYYIKLDGENGRPVLYLANGQVAAPLADVIEFTEAITESRKMTPLLDPSILGPAARVRTHAQGEKIGRGRAFHTLDCPGQLSRLTGGQSELAGMAGRQIKE